MPSTKWWTVYFLWASEPLGSVSWGWVICFSYPVRTTNPQWPAVSGKNHFISPRALFHLSPRRSYHPPWAVQGPCPTEVVSWQVPRRGIPIIFCPFFYSSTTGHETIWRNIYSPPGLKNLPANQSHTPRPEGPLPPVPTVFPRPNSGPPAPSFAPRCAIFFTQEFSHIFLESRNFTNIEFCFLKFWFEV